MKKGFGIIWIIIGVLLLSACGTSSKLNKNMYMDVNENSIQTLTFDVSKDSGTLKIDTYKYSNGEVVTNTEEVSITIEKNGFYTSSIVPGTGELKGKKITLTVPFVGSSTFEQSSEKELEKEIEKLK